MDNRQRPLREYFNAVRSQPGISENEIRTIVRAGSAKRGMESPRRLRGGKLLLGGGLLLALSGALFMMIQTQRETAIPHNQSVTAVTSRSSGAGEKDAKSPVLPHLEDGGDVPMAVSYASKVFKKTTNNTSITDQENNGMKTRKATSKLVVTTMATMMSAATLSLQAQTVESRPKDDGAMHPVVQQMQMEMGRAASDYWMSKLNDYKVRIDQVLAPNDLDELNRLRVRFNVLVLEFIQKEMTKTQTQEERKRETQEMLAMYNAAREMARRYRADLDGLGESVVNDLSDFLPAMNLQADNFAAGRQAELKESGYAKTYANARQKSEEIAATLHSSQGRTTVRMVYGMFVEPVVMLYDGTDLRTLVRQLEQLSMGGKGLPLPASAIAGYKLPETSMLKQNVPNPASSGTEIPYTVDEESSSTILRIFDAQGKLLANYDEGARGVGEYSVKVEVQSLPPGTYLYHLTMTTAKGNRIYSKTMQVVR